MKHLLCPTTYEQVLQEDPWECFLCKSRSFTTDTIVRPRANWKDKIINMFRTSCDSNVEHLVAKHNSEKRKIRVLSLFDGLGTGLHIEFTTPISFLLFYLVISFLVYFTLEDRCFQKLSYYFLLFTLCVFLLFLFHIPSSRRQMLSGLLVLLKLLFFFLLSYLFISFFIYFPLEDRCFQVCSYL